MIAGPTQAVGQCLDDFRSIGANHVDANDSVGFPVHDELHDGLLISLGNGVPERGELGEIDIDLPELKARLCFREAHT